MKKITKQIHKYVVFGILGLIIALQNISISNNVGLRLNDSKNLNPVEEPLIAAGNWIPNGTAICINPTMWYENPQIIADNSGGAIICWFDLNFGNMKIYAQRIDSSGNSLWNPNGTIICNTAGDRMDCFLCSDGDGGAIIAWEDTRKGNYDIYAQRINATGDIEWTPNGIVVSNASYSQSSLDICSDGYGGAIITWVDNRNSGFGGDIYAQKIDNDGNPIWNLNGTLVCNAISFQEYPKVINDGEGGGIIVWQDLRNSVYDIYAQRIDSTGGIQWDINGTNIADLPFSQNSPRICSDGQGGAIICWDDSRDLGTNGRDIYAQRIDKAGTILWDNNGIVICNSINDQQFPELCSDKNGGAIIAWSDYRGSTGDIYSQKINSSGDIEWNSNGVRMTTLGVQMYPEILSDGTGGAFIVFMDTRGIEHDLSIQHIDSNGNLEWNLNGMYITKAKNFQDHHKICLTTLGVPIITWRDQRERDDIYATVVIEMPITNHPADIITDKYGTEEITWSIYGTSTSSNGRYRVFANNSKGNMVLIQDWTSWTDESSYSILINRSAPGYFIYFIEFQEFEYYYGGYDEVYVEIIDKIPYSNQPPDIITNITEWSMIEWIIYDEYFEGYFRVRVNDTNNNYYTWMDWSPWINGTIIFVPINRIALGTFNYTIEFNTSSGLFARDSILVTIVEPPDDEIDHEGNGNGGWNILDLISYILSGSAISFGLIAIILFLVSKRSVSKE